MTVSNNRTISTLTERDVSQCISTIKDLHPNWRVEDEKRLVKLWHFSLAKYPTQEVKRATIEVASKSKYIPKLADIIEILEKPIVGMQSIGYENNFAKLNKYLTTLTQAELTIFNQRVQAYVIGDLEEINEYELISANTWIELIEACEISGVENESIKRYLRGE